MPQGISENSKAVNQQLVEFKNLRKERKPTPPITLLLHGYPEHAKE